MTRGNLPRRLVTGLSALTLAATGLAGAAASGAMAAAPPAAARARTASPAVTVVVDTATGHRAISPMIYGINDDKDLDPSFGAEMQSLRPGLVRLGGNRWTAYNWVTNASNAGSDYLYENDGYLTPSTVPGHAVLPTVQGAAAAGAAAVVTVPVNGYVSADESGPVNVNDPNRLATRFKPEQPTGPLTTTPDPKATTIYQNQFVDWLMHAAPKAKVLYELDNEPDLWDSTHQEVHPAQTTYAELLSKDLAYAKAIKAVDPAAEVSGPVSYGWEGYETLQNAPDSGSDGNFLDWYLRGVAAADKAAGKRLVDDLDLHWYPEATGPTGRITNDDTSPGEVAAREQAPRSLWDPTYVENSWITKDSTGGKAIALIPRVDAQIAAGNPGTRLALTEWDYGAGGDISGAIADADVLGIFGRYGVHAAAYWALDSSQSYADAAFTVYRNYDGAGASFGDTEVTATTSDRVGTSAYASVQSTDPGRVVVVLINKNTTATSTAVKLEGGLQASAASVWTLTAAGGPQMVRAPGVAATSDVFRFTMPAQSVTVLVPSTTPLAPGVGYYLAGRAGAVLAAGRVPNLPGFAPGAGDRVVGIVTTPDGKGYLAVTSNGAVHTAGDAVFRGDLLHMPAGAPEVRVSDVVAIARTPTGRGYWLIGADGGMFAFGDARYRGSLPGLGLHVTDIRQVLPAPKGTGYLLVGADGGTFSFGRGAPYRGSLPAEHVKVSDIVGIALTRTGLGYWMAGSDGVTYNFGDAPPLPAPAGLAGALPIAAIAGA